MECYLARSNRGLDGTRLAPHRAVNRPHIDVTHLPAVRSAFPQRRSMAARHSATRDWTNPDPLQRWDSSLLLVPAINEGARKPGSDGIVFVHEVHIDARERQ